MRRTILRRTISTIFIILFAAFSLPGENAMNEYLSLYDFNESELISEFEWQGFTDQVMGGKSEIATRMMLEEDDRFIRMEGDVSLENNGGFIQISLRLARGLNSYKASDYDGVRLETRGKGSGYYIFIRTSNTVLPWQFYKAELDAAENWQIIDIPWSAFEKGDYGSFGKLNPARLKSIALVAYGKEFRAEIDLKSIGLYRK